MMALPTPAQRDLFRRHRRGLPKVVPTDPSELQMHIALVTRLRLQCRKDVVFLHCPNGEERDKRVAAKLKAMGVLPGVSDLIFFMPALKPQLFLELKARGRGLTESQKAFAFMVRKQGHIYEWTDSLDDAVRILKEREILPRGCE